MIETKYDIDDVVFTALSTGTDRKIINAVKATKKGIYYGFETSSTSFFASLWSDGISWYPQEDVFQTKEAAASRVKELERRQEKEKGKERKKEIESVKKSIEHDQERLSALLEGREPEYSDEDDED